MYSWLETHVIVCLDDGLIIVAMILAIGLAVTAIFGESSLQSRVLWNGAYPAIISNEWFTKNTITSQL